MLLVACCMFNSSSCIRCMLVLRWYKHIIPVLYLHLPGSGEGGWHTNKASMCTFIICGEHFERKNVLLSFVGPGSPPNIQSMCVPEYPLIDNCVIELFPQTYSLGNNNNNNNNQHYNETYLICAIRCMIYDINIWLKPYHMT